MTLTLQTAYRGGRTAAFNAFGIKEAGIPGVAGKALGRGMQWTGRALSTIPLVGNVAGAALSGVGGATQALASGEGLKGALIRGGLSGGASLIPGGGGIAAGIGADMAADKLLAPTGPKPQHMPGAIGHGALPGMVM
jgi:hypothetical protein